jgi:restriction endonuclease S subunit
MSAARSHRWLSLTISEIADFGSGDSISVARLSDRSAASPIPVFGGNGIAGYTSSATVSQPTVILGRVGQKCGVVYRNSGPAWITDNALYVRRYKRPVDVDFLALALEAARLNDVRNRNDLPLITQSILKDVKIAWPGSIEEQRHIGEAVSDADKTIDAVKGMITKKQAIRHGMMQRLLTGRTHLPGFTDAWVRLVDVTVRIGSGITPRGGAAVYKASGRPFVRSQNVGWGKLRLADMAHIDEATHMMFPGSEIRADDVLLNITGASIGRSAVATAELHGGNVNQHVCEIRLKPGIMDPHFVNAVLASKIGQSQIDAVQAGGNRQGLNFQQVGSIMIPAPNIDQQRRVGRVLADADNEIATLQRFYDKANAIKQGMMQQLLTGRTRLPVPEATS